MCLFCCLSWFCVCLESLHEFKLKLQFFIDFFTFKITFSSQINFLIKFPLYFIIAEENEKSRKYVSFSLHLIVQPAIKNEVVRFICIRIQNGFLGK